METSAKGYKCRDLAFDEKDVILNPVDSKRKDAIFNIEFYSNGSKTAAWSKSLAKTESLWCCSLSDAVITTVTPTVSGVTQAEIELFDRKTGNSISTYQMKDEPTYQDFNKGNRLYVSTKGGKVYSLGDGDICESIEMKQSNKSIESPRFQINGKQLDKKIPKAA